MAVAFNLGFSLASQHSFVDGVHHHGASRRVGAGDGAARNLIPLEEAARFGGRDLVDFKLAPNDELLIEGMIQARYALM